MRRTLSTLKQFLADEAIGGIVLIAAAALAMILANSPLAGEYFHLLHAETGPVLAPAIGPMTVHLWVNDGLMALFFLLVGLEIKREIVAGELSRPADRRLPLVAALAGMAVPAMVYLAISWDDPSLRPGWAIPAATDIAFAVGVLALLGRRVPAQLKLFLTTVAIVDDMGAVAIIALFYSKGIDLGALLAGAGLFDSKQTGMLGGIALADRLGIAPRPRASWSQLYGVLLLAGIGFTMSLFIGGLAFADAARMDAVKIGVLVGSLLSALAGFTVLRWIARPAT